MERKILALILIVGIIVSLVIAVLVIQFIQPKESIYQEIGSTVTSGQPSNDVVIPENTAVIPPQLKDSSFTKYEIVQFTSGYADLVGTNFVVTLNFKNTGSATATFDNSTIFYNGKPAAGFSPSDQPNCILNGSISSTLNLLPGESNYVTITMVKGNIWFSRMSIEVLLQSSAGMQYPKVIELP